MTLKHIVLFKSKENVSEEKLKEVADTLEKLEKIKGVVSITFGAKEEIKEGEDRAQGYTHALITTVKDKKALKKYADDKRHQEALEILRTVFTKDDTVAIDVIDDKDKCPDLYKYGGVVSFVGLVVSLGYIFSGKKKN